MSRILRFVSSFVPSIIANTTSSLPLNNPPPPHPTQSSGFLMRPDAYTTLSSCAAPSGGVLTEYIGMLDTYM